MRVFVVEDNDELRSEILLPSLRVRGFLVKGASNAAEFYRLMVSQPVDIVVLDVGLPDEDGYTIAAHLRSISDIGIVVLTGHDGRDHQLHALNAGADLYLTKPVDLEVLAASLHNLARRIAVKAPTQVRDISPDTPALPGWRLQTGGWRLISPKGKVLALTAAEQCVAITLAAQQGKPVSRPTLISALAKNACDFDPHRLDMMIHRWRRKALSSTGEPLPLITVRSNGYMLDCEIDASVPTL